MNILAVLDYNKFADNYIREAELIESSITYLWYRIKSDDATIYKRAKMLRDRVSKCKLILSNNIAIATALQFDGVHLNKNSLPVDVVKKIAPNMIVGYSAHTVAEIDSLNADYFTLSPICESKSPTLPTIDIERLDIERKVFALGGVKLKDYNILINKGFYGIAGIRLISELANHKNNTEII